MSRKIVTGTLKQAVKTKPTACDQRVRARVAVNTAMPKEASKRAAGDAIQKRSPARARVVGKNKSAAAMVTTDEISLATLVTPQPELAQEITLHAAVAATPAVDPRIQEEGALTWGTMVIWLGFAWKWLSTLVGCRKSKKRLRVCETVSLGDKRFVAVIEVDGEQFLVGGASNSVATLARLTRSQEFSEVLSQRWAQDPMQA